MTVSSDRRQRRERRLLVLCALVGMTLVVIGIRFHLAPERARAFFGLPAAEALSGLHSVVAIRDIWVGLLAIALAALREWRALAIWLGLGVLVCFSDAALVATSGGKVPAIAFHTVSGLVCGALAVATWRAGQAPQG
jgi:hypothetical protein